MKHLGEEYYPMEVERTTGGGGKNPGGFPVVAAAVTAGSFLMCSLRVSLTRNMQSNQHLFLPLF
jgi:hypothetical protein